MLETLAGSATWLWDRLNPFQVWKRAKAAEAEVARLKAFDGSKHAYARYDVEGPERDGQRNLHGTVYVPRKGPFYVLCANCFEKRVRSEISRTQNGLECPTCKQLIAAPWDALNRIREQRDAN